MPSLVPQKIPNLLQKQQLHGGMVEKAIFQRFSRENALLTKKCLFCFRPSKLVFVLLKGKCQTKLVEVHKFKQQLYKAKAFSSPEHIDKEKFTPWKLTSLGAKVNKPKST